MSSLFPPFSFHVEKKESDYEFDFDFIRFRIIVVIDFVILCSSAICRSDYGTDSRILINIIYKNNKLFNVIIMRTWKYTQYEISWNSRYWVHLPPKWGSGRSGAWLVVEHDSYKLNNPRFLFLMLIFFFFGVCCLLAFSLKL